MSGTTTLVWFRRDLRLPDNPALTAAVADSDHVVAMYVHAPEEESPGSPGAATRWWLPELTNLPDKWIHRPWEAPEEVLAQAVSRPPTPESALAGFTYWPGGCSTPTIRSPSNRRRSPP